MILYISKHVNFASKKELNYYRSSFPDIFFKITFSKELDYQ